MYTLVMSLLTLGPIPIAINAERSWSRGRDTLSPSITLKKVSADFAGPQSREGGDNLAFASLMHCLTLERNVKPHPVHHGGVH